MTCWFLAAKGIQELQFLAFLTCVAGRHAQREWAPVSGQSVRGLQLTSGAGLQECWGRVDGTTSRRPLGYVKEFIFYVEYKGEQETVKVR